MQPIDLAEFEPGIAAEAAAHTSKRPLVLVGILAVVLVAAIAGVVVEQARRNADTASALAARQAQVQQNGAQVMPFDQNLTAHQFAKTDTGGVETVTANDPNDAQQAKLVQDHLQHERDLFSTGNFSDPMAVHGHQMPGIAGLQHGASSGQVTVAYEALPAGARLTYTAATPSAGGDRPHMVRRAADGPRLPRHGLTANNDVGPRCVLAGSGT